ncbi:hypothetical protein ACOMHN_053976 [Nucella lapillus]
MLPSQTRTVLSAAHSGSSLPVGKWQHGLTECLKNKSMCMITYMAPCYQYSLNAEAMDHNCVACCIIYMFATCLCSTGCMGAYLRTLIRDKKGIEGTPLMDCLVHCVMPCKALIQEGHEVEIAKPQEIDRE